MTADYIVSSLPALSLEAPPPISWERFVEFSGLREADLSAWNDMETQLRNAAAEARAGDASFNHPAEGCSLYWKSRVAACFREADVAKRDLMIDKVWWDAAGELTPSWSPLGRGAIATYAIRLKLVLKRAKISKEAGSAAFEKMAGATDADFLQSVQNKAKADTKK